MHRPIMCVNIGKKDKDYIWFLENPRNDVKKTKYRKKVEGNKK